MNSSVSLPDSNNLSTIPFLVFLTLYINIKSYSSSISSLSFLKGKINSLAGLLLKICVICSLIYNISYEILSKNFKINKIELEITETFRSAYNYYINGYNLDIVRLMINSLKISQILFISIIFMSISLLIPSYKEVEDENNFLTKQNSLLCSFCKMWSIFRIPILFYSSFLKNLIYEKLVFFIVIVFSNIEIFLASIFVIYIKIKNQKISNFDLGIFSSILFFYGIFKYTINLIDLPFELSNENLNLVYTIQFVLMISIYLFLCEIIYPNKIIKKSSTPIVNQNIQPHFEVALLESVIEFENTKKSNK